MRHTFLAITLICNGGTVICVLTDEGDAESSPIQRVGEEIFQDQARVLLSLTTHTVYALRSGVETVLI